MQKEDVIFIAEDDQRHSELIRKNLLRAGIYNKILSFVDGQEILDFLCDTEKDLEAERKNQEYILLLDLSIPRVDGVEVLEKIKRDIKLKRIPVIILTKADDPDTIERCHSIGCSTYIVKPTEYEGFEKTVQKIGRFLSVVEITSIK